MNKYDIFISYRRDGGAQYARILQLMLQQRGYRVFLDYDELTDGVFSEQVKAAIIDAPVFMLVLSKHSMERCVNADDWVRREIMLAIENGKHFVPINPDKSFDGFGEEGDGGGLPKEIRDAVGYHQHSEIDFGQTLGVTLDLMIRKRLVPTLGKRTGSGHIDEDYDSARETLLGMEAHNKRVRRMVAAGVVGIVVAVVVSCLIYFHQKRERDEKQLFRSEMQERWALYGMQLRDDLSMEQMRLVDSLMRDMVCVREDDFWIGKYEFSQGMWYGLQAETCDDEEGAFPMTNVSYAEIMSFLGELMDMTGVMFTLPSAEDWRYAALGGEKMEGLPFAGDSVADRVAWYSDNSGGRSHRSDGQQGKGPNWLDLYDMCGNVGELTNTPFDISLDDIPYTVCGGDYNSPASEVTIDSRRAFATDDSDETVGFRLAIYK